MQDALQILREFGFPIFVCVWFMYRLERKLDRHDDRLSQLLMVVTVIAKTLDVDEGEAAESPYKKTGEAP
jgi:hypothetical protein